MLQWTLNLDHPATGRRLAPPARLGFPLGRVAAGTFVAAAPFLLVDFAAAQSAAARPNKSSYHLFRPTPGDLMRGLETDRPDQTESPIPVDAGHFQIEADFFSYSDSRRGSVHQTELTAPSLNLKLGLLNSVDLQVVLQPFNRDLGRRFSAYVEFSSAVSRERGSEWHGTFDFGFNYLLNRNLKFDAGLNIGVTDRAPDWAPFIGVTWRY